MTSRIRHARPVLAAALLGPALLVGAAGSADAGTLRFRDADRDVAVTSYDRASGFQRRIDAAQRNPDISQVVVRNDVDQIAVTVGLRAFDGVDTGWAAVIVTSKGDRLDLRRSVSTGADAPGPTVTVLLNGRRFSCPGLAVSRTSVGVIARVPSGCLDDPYRVRVGVKVRATYQEGGVGDQYGDDDAYRYGGDYEQPVALLPWVAR